MLETIWPTLMTRDLELDNSPVPPTRITDVVTLWAERLPNHPALVESSGAWTYKQLASAIADAQLWLQRLGVRPGDRVMIVGENCREFVTILLALAGIDAWPVLVNARLSSREIGEIRNHSGARRVFYTISASQQAADHAKHDGAVVEELAGLGAVGISALNEETEPEPLDTDIANRVAALIYTSGTTGLPKGVMLTNRNLLFMADRIGAGPIGDVGRPIVRRFADVSCGRSFRGVVGFTCSQEQRSISYPRFDPMTARVTLEKDGITLLLGTPAIFNQLLQYAKLRKISSLRVSNSSDHFVFGRSARPCD